MTAEKHTNKGFDQENNAPENANETQSTGVPEKSQNQIQTPLDPQIKCNIGIK